MAKKKPVVVNQNGQSDETEEMKQMMVKEYKILELKEKAQPSAAGHVWNIRDLFLQQLIDDSYEYLADPQDWTSANTQARRKVMMTALKSQLSFITQLSDLHDKQRSVDKTDRLMHAERSDNMDLMEEARLSLSRVGIKKKI